MSEDSCEKTYCDRPRRDGDKYCIFHSEDVDGKKTEFDEKFMEEFGRQKESDDKYYFKGFVFPDFSFSDFLFDKTVIFRDVKFSGKVDFCRSKFLCKTQFLGTEFSGKADFSHAKFLGTTKFENTSLRGVNLNNADLHGANLQDTNLKGVDLRGTNLEEANVQGVKYNRRGRYKGIRLGGCFGSQMFERFARDQSYIEEFKSSPVRFLIYLIWFILSDCGRSLLLWASWAGFMAFGFAVKFYSLGPDVFEVAHLKHSFGAMIYYSVVTFTTLGFGDITPKTAEGALWVTLEVIAGYVMLGGLISILANKLARRS